MNSMKLTIVIPAHNEEASLYATISSLEAIVMVPHEVIVVNDHSSDNTAKTIDELSVKFNNIRLINNDTEPGFTNAIKKGFSKARGEMIVLVMADSCDDPHSINEMYKKIMEGYDVVCASRYMKHGKKLGGRFLQTLFSRWSGLSLCYLTGIPTHDASNAFKITEIPTVWKDRVAGESNFRIWKVIRNYFRWYLWAVFARKEKL